MGGQGRSWTGTGAAVRALVLVCAVLVWIPASSVGARQKPGPVTIRGVATGVHAAGFTLQTKSAGSYTIQLSSDTAITEKGKQGRQTIHDGDHVGVHGFVKGRNIRAMYVHIYPSRAARKGYTLVGTVQSVGTGYVVVASGGKRVRISLGSGTSIRVGSTPGSARDIRVGEKVSIRVVPSAGGLAATRVHVYRTSGGTSQQVDGTVVQVLMGSVVIRQGATSFRITVNSSTRVYMGNTVASLSSLHAGQTVTVYACCRGQSLVARSIHIKRASAVHATVSLAGRVESIGGATLVLSSSGKTIRVALRPATILEVGSARVPVSGIRVGDQVTVRAYRQGGTLVATRVHVLAASRKLHTVSGVVVGVSSGRIVVLARSTRYVVTAPGARITLSGNSTTLAALRVGDHVRVSGRLTGTSMVAITISARRVAPKLRVVRGVVSAVGASGFSVVTTTGARYLVTLGRGVRPTLNGNVAPRDALFVGVHITVRGILSGVTLLASSVTLSERTESLSGRLRSVRGETLTVFRASGAARRVDVPPDVRVRDGTSRRGLSSLHPGTYLEVHGYAESSGRIRATAIDILHPSLDITGVLVTVLPALTLQTTRGEQYRLSLTAQTQISAERAAIELAARDLPAGVHVHVVGTMRSDGTLAVQQLVARLQSVTLAGSVQAVASSSMTLGMPTGGQKVRIESVTSVVQGSKSIDLASIVPGDDVTVDGYRAGGGWIIARKVTVHRRLIGLDGYISALAGDSVSLTVSTGATVQVEISDATQITGGTIALGWDVHVTGYRRGDGVVLATRVRVGKPHG